MYLLTTFRVISDYHICDANLVLIIFGGCPDSYLERNSPRAFGLFYQEDDVSITAAGIRTGSQHEEPILVRIGGTCQISTKIPLSIGRFG